MCFLLRFVEDGEASEEEEGGGERKKQERNSKSSRFQLIDRPRCFYHKVVGLSLIARLMVCL